MRRITVVNLNKKLACCGSTDKTVAQCCAKKSKLVQGCHD